jgi:hypothetical protein
VSFDPDKYIKLDSWILKDAWRKAWDSLEQRRITIKGTEQKITDAEYLLGLILDFDWYPREKK